MTKEQDFKKHLFFIFILLEIAFVYTLQLSEFGVTVMIFSASSQQIFKCAFFTSL